MEVIYTIFSWIYRPFEIAIQFVTQNTPTIVSIPLVFILFVLLVYVLLLVVFSPFILYILIFRPNERGYLLRMLALGPIAIFGGIFSSLAEVTNTSKPKQYKKPTRPKLTKKQKQALKKKAQYEAMIQDDEDEVFYEDMEDYWDKH